MSIAIVSLLIPIIAILGSYYIKLQKMQLDKAGLSEGDKKLIDQVRQDNADLKTRVENLESIVTSLDKELLALQSPSYNPLETRQKAEELARQMKSGL